MSSAQKLPLAINIHSGLQPHRLGIMVKLNPETFQRHTVDAPGVIREVTQTHRPLFVLQKFATSHEVQRYESLRDNNRMKCHLFRTLFTIGFEGSAGHDPIHNAPPSLAPGCIPRSEASTNALRVASRRTLDYAREHQLLRPAARYCDDRDEEGESTDDLTPDQVDERKSIRGAMYAIAKEALLNPSIATSCSNCPLGIIKGYLTSSLLFAWSPSQTTTSAKRVYRAPKT